MAAQEWNTTFEGTPADAANISEGAERIRELKQSITQVVANDHKLDPSEASTDDDGKHDKVTLIASSSAPTFIVDEDTADSCGGLYSLAVDPGGDHSALPERTELFYRYDAGGLSKLSQLTSQGNLANIPTGSHMIFVQDTVPLGWTLYETNKDRIPLFTNNTDSGVDPDHGTQTGGTVWGNWLMQGLGFAEGEFGSDGTTEATGLNVEQMPRHTHYTWTQTYGAEVGNAGANKGHIFGMGASWGATDTDNPGTQTTPGAKQLDTKPTGVDAKGGYNTAQDTIFESRPEGGYTGTNGDGDQGDGTGTGSGNGISSTTDSNYFKTYNSGDDGEDHSHEIKNRDSQKALLAWRPNYVTALECIKGDGVIDA